MSASGAVECVFAIPGDLRLPTGGYAYDRRLIALLPEHGVNVRHLELPHGYPDPSARDLSATADAFAKVAPDAVLMVDGLAYGAMTPDVIAAARAPIVALVHHPLGYENGISPARRDALIASERAALALARSVIVTSPATAALLSAEFGVAAAGITVAEPGTDPREPAIGSGPSEPLRILAVGSVVPRKGYDVLVRALSGLGGHDWTLEIVGALDRAPETATALQAQIVANGLRERIVLRGALPDDRLDVLYRSADLFVLSSLFEGYGMVLAEALAYGLPIVTTTGGAAAETVPDAAALKVPPGDADALRDALARAIGDPNQRVQLAKAARESAEQLPRWPDIAGRVAATLHKVAEQDRETGR